MKDYHNYIAFISHRSTDHEAAEWLLKKLEHYPIGGKIRKEYDISRKYLKPVCLDQYEFASKDLIKEMTSKLDNSAKMILLCSKASASPYADRLDWSQDPSIVTDWMADPYETGFVGYEIAYMISKGREKDILAVVIDGDPAKGDCFHPLVREWMKQKDIYYDFSKGKKTDRQTFLKLVSAILDIENFSEIFDHDAKRKRLFAAGYTGLAAAVLASGIWAWNYFLPHEKHFEDYVMVNGIPQGVNELSSSQYSASVDHYIITTAKSSHRITMSHVNAMLTPLEESVSARIDSPMIAVYQCRSNWNPDTVEFRDRNGIVQMTYAYTTDLKYVSFQENEYTSNQVYPTTQTDDYGIPLRMKIDRYDLTFDDNGRMTRRMYMSGVNYVIDESGVAGESYSYDDNGRITGMRYLNSQRETSENQNGIGGIDYEYDEQGRLIRQTYVDKNGNPVCGTEWYSYIVYDYSDKGALVTSTYYSTEGEETVWSDGYSRSQKSYDASNNMIREEFFGPEDEPLYCSDKYHRADYAYNGKGDCISVSYFDHEDNAVIHSDGYSKIEWDKDEKGNPIETRYFNTKGGLMPSETYAAVIERTYNNAGILIEEKNYGSERNEIINKDGYFRRTIEVDRSGKPEKITVYGINNMPVYHAEGWHTMAFAYDDRGNLSEISLYDINDQLIPFNGQWAVQKRTYNGGGQVTSTSYEDRFGNSVNTKGLYARLENTYDDRGLLTSTSYYDTSGNLTDGMRMTQGGFYAGDRRHAIVEYEYDEDGNMVRTIYRGENGDLFGAGMDTIRQYTYDDVGRLTKVEYLTSQGVYVNTYEAIMEYNYDQYGRVASTSYYDYNNQPVNSLNTHAAFSEYERDFRGNITKRKSLDKDGNLSGEYYTVEYDSRGLETRRDFYDINDMHAMTEDGYATLLVEYNDAGQRIRTTSLDLSGNPTTNSSGFSIGTRTYDTNGNQIGMNYFDTDGNPVDLPAGYHGYTAELNDFRYIKDIRYYDKDGKTIVRYSADYKDDVYITEELLFGKNDEPIGDRDFMIAKIVNTYDENNQKTSAFYYDRNGDLRLLGYRFAGWSSEYLNGQESSRTYYGTDGKPLIQIGGFASAHFERNEIGQEIRRTYFDAEGNPVNTDYGFSTIEVTYNDLGEIETAVYLDTEGNSVEPAGQVILADMYLSNDYKTVTYTNPETGVSRDVDYQIDPQDVRVLAYQDENGEFDMLRQPYFPLMTAYSDIGDYIYMSLMSFIPDIDEQTEAEDLSQETELEGWQKLLKDYIGVIAHGDADSLMAMMDLSAVRGMYETLEEVVNNPRTYEEFMQFYTDLYQNALTEMQTHLTETYGSDYVISYEILQMSSYEDDLVLQLEESMKEYISEEDAEGYHIESVVGLTVRYTVSGTKGSGMETESYLTPAMVLFKINGKWTLGSGNGFPKASRDELYEFFGGYKTN